MVGIGAVEMTECGSGFYSFRPPKQSSRACNAASIRAQRRLVTPFPLMAGSATRFFDRDDMRRVCFVLQVKTDRLQEYRERHRAVWPEMLEALREAGWQNYSLFLRQDGLLVGYLETEDFERARSEMARRNVNQRWQREMADFFDQGGVEPDRAMEPLEEVFHL